jgi:hypothetical protein
VLALAKSSGATVMPPRTTGVIRNASATASSTALTNGKFVSGYRSHLSARSVSLSVGRSGTAGIRRLRSSMR